MIEKAPAVENLEALLSVKGVDMVQFGPADYAMSIGLPGQWAHPQVKEAERFVIDTALKMGIAPRAEIAHPEQAKAYLDMGVQHFCIGWDVSILFEWFKTNGKAMRDLLGMPPTVDKTEKSAAGYGKQCHQRLTSAMCWLPAPARRHLPRR
jgi:4-hydroxy-2-oxoheptanedioate aldolase